MSIPFDLSKVPWPVFHAGDLKRLGGKLTLFEFMTLSHVGTTLSRFATGNAATRARNSAVPVTRLGNAIPTAASATTAFIKHDHIEQTQKFSSKNYILTEIVMAKKGVKKASPNAAVKKNVAPGVAAPQPKTYSETVGTADLPDHIYTQLKICLSKITGFSIDNIFTTDSLASKFHFNPGGQRVLAQNLESCFAQAGFPIPKKLDRDAMQNATDVGSVATIINTAFGV